MKKSPVAMFLLFGAFVGCSTTGGGPQAKSLFNGHDLAGWVVMYGGEWTVEDGVLVGRNGKDWSTNPEKSGSWLRTEEQYGDFIPQQREHRRDAPANIQSLLRSPTPCGLKSALRRSRGDHPTRETAR